MGFDLNGNKLEASAGLVVNSSTGNRLLKQGTTGVLQRYNSAQPLFRAGSTSSTAVAIGAVDTWTPLVLPTTIANVGACYNTANGRFTAPVSGLYMFRGNTYISVMPTTGGYIHCMFWVNGSGSIRRPSGPLHRIHMHGITGGYSGDTEGFEIILLTAGDYVQYYQMPGGYSSTIAPQHCTFEGYLLS